MTTNNLAALARLHYRSLPPHAQERPLAQWVVRLADEVERLEQQLAAYQTRELGESLIEGFESEETQ